MKRLSLLSVYAVVCLSAFTVAARAAIQPAFDGSLTLPATDAEIHAPQQVSPAQISGQGGNAYISTWYNPQSYVEWTIEIKQPGLYAVEAEVATTGDSARLVVGAGDANVEVTVPTTGSYGKYTTIKAGELKISKKGRQTLSVKPRVEGWNPVNIRRLTLIPAAAARDSNIRSFDVVSPNGSIKGTVRFDANSGTLSCQAFSGDTEVLGRSPMGIVTDLMDFRGGMTLAETTRAVIDETYTLPLGKVSTYRNEANELTLALDKDGHRLNVVMRAYDDGVAFRYAIPGSGDVQITDEATSFRLPGKPVYWGQSHPNRYGYENPLGQIEHQAYSLALLCELKAAEHWVLLTQAATYADYCIPHLRRAKDDRTLLKVTFPIDQKEPIKTTLPFASPWRVAVISPADLSTIVEQTLFENLNPPTEPELVDADWVQPGRSRWDLS